MKTKMERKKEKKKTRQLEEQKEKNISLNKKIETMNPGTNDVETAN